MRVFLGSSAFPPSGFAGTKMVSPYERAPDTFIMNPPPIVNPPQVNKWIITASVMIPTLIQILDSSIVNVALNNIQGNLSTNRETVTWVITTYMIANAVVIPMSAWLARFMGRKRFLLASIALFTLSSVLCGMATSLTQLVLFRVVQGIGGGGLQPMSAAILFETFPAHERGMAMSVFGMGAVLGPILGPILGGYLTDHFSWRWAFYINLPIGIWALFMNASFVFDPPYQQRRAKGEKVDYMGMILLCVGLGSLQVVLDRGQEKDWFSSQLILALLVIAVACLTLFIIWELGHEMPVLDLRVFKDLSFASGNAVMFLGIFAFFGSIVLLPLYLQGLMGYNAFLSGLVLGPGGAVTLVTMPLVGRLTQRVDSRKLLFFGILVTGYSAYMMAGFNLHIDVRAVVHTRLIQGFGMSFFFIPLSYIAMASVSNERMNNASAIFNLVRNMGASFGVAFVSTLLARRTQFHHHRLVEHLTPFDMGFSMRLQELEAGLAAKLGDFVDHPQLAGSIIYRMLQRESAALAFNDAFFAQTVLFVGLIGLLWIMRKPPVSGVVS